MDYVGHKVIFFHRLSIVAIRFIFFLLLFIREIKFIYILVSAEQETNKQTKLAYLFFQRERGVVGMRPLDYRIAANEVDELKEQSGGEVEEEKEKEGGA
jgi:hypothetical protein